MEENKCLITKALHNLGYRCVGMAKTVVVFGKPIGYGILRVLMLVKGTKAKLEVMLIVKTLATDAEPAENLVFQSERCTLSSSDKTRDDYYLEVMRFVSDSEALIMHSPVDWEHNRFVRYDFRENVKLLNELLNLT